MNESSGAICRMMCIFSVTSTASVQNAPREREGRSVMQCDSFCPITFSTAPTCFVCSFHGRCKKEAAPGATNTGDDKADTLPIVSASNDTKDFRRFQDER